MRRRRKRRGTWFPVNGHTTTTGVSDTYSYSDLRLDSGSVPSGNGQSPAQFLFPVLPDFTEQQGAGAIVSNPQLQDIVSGQTWVLDRFVGKIHLEVNGNNTSVDPEQSWANVYVVAGLFVARAEDDAPAQIALQATDIEPQAKDNSMNPWIWRRSWILSNPQKPTTFAKSTWPVSNAHFGSVMDGPHIDSRVNRYIPREHRLWFILSARGYDPARLEVGIEEAQPSVSGLLDYRIYGRLAKSKNLSTF